MGIAQIFKRKTKSHYVVHSFLICLILYVNLKVMPDYALHGRVNFRVDNNNIKLSTQSGKSEQSYL